MTDEYKSFIFSYHYLFWRLLGRGASKTGRIYMIYHTQHNITHIYEIHTIVYDKQK
jgi:hypothetical protein